MKMTQSIGVLCIALAVFLGGAKIGCADSQIPNLVGTWVVKAEGAVLQRGAGYGVKTHHKGEFSTLTAEAVVEKQKGPVLHGTFTSPRATEKFVAVIGPDNRTFSYADEDGFVDGRIVDKDTIQITYRHVTPVDTVVATGVWTRKK